MHVQIMKRMLYYDEIGVFEGVDVSKTRESKEFNTCHY